MPDIPDMTPEIADVARDVLALVRAALTENHEATATIVNALDYTDMRDRLISMSLLTSSLMRSRYGDFAEEHMTTFAREFLT